MLRPPSSLASATRSGGSPRSSGARPPLRRACFSSMSCRRRSRALTLRTAAGLAARARSWRSLSWRWTRCTATRGCLCSARPTPQGCSTRPFSGTGASTLSSRSGRLSAPRGAAPLPPARVAPRRCPFCAPRPPGTADVRTALTTAHLPHPSLTPPPSPSAPPGTGGATRRRRTPRDPRAPPRPPATRLPSRGARGARGAPRVRIRRGAARRRPRQFPSKPHARGAGGRPVTPPAAPPARRAPRVLRMRSARRGARGGGRAARRRGSGWCDGFCNSGATVV